MKHIMGVLCCVSFMATIACYMVGWQSDVSTEVREVNTNDHTVVRQDWPAEGKVEKAKTLEIVWMDGCAPCRRMKVVAITLIAEGYDIILTNKDYDIRGSVRFPSLYYLDEYGGLIRTEIGFKTPTHIKEYLGK